MRILVCGGRDHDDYEQVRDVLHGLLDEFPITYGDEYKTPDPKKITIVHGGAEGADSHADDWCVVNWIVPEVYPADWETHGKAAGPIRNQQMLDTGIDLVLAFPTENSRGTWHMVKIAEKAGVPVRVFRPRTGGPSEASH